jgi:GT2 family glycosyltransferase
LAFIDSDCVPADDWLAAGWRRLEQHREAGLIAGRVDITLAKPGRPTTAEYYESLMAFNMERNVRKYRFGGTGNLFVHRAVMDHVGPFDAGLHSSEDVEWGNRVHAAGLPLVYAPEVVVMHGARRSFRDLARKMRRTTGGIVQLRRQREGRPLGRRLTTPLRAVGRVLYVAAIPPYTLARLVQQRRLDRPGKAVPLLFLMWGLQAVRAAELARLALGGQPIR